MNWKSCSAASKCRKTHPCDYRISKFSGGACPQNPLEGKALPALPILCPGVKLSCPPVQNLNEPPETSLINMWCFLEGFLSPSAEKKVMQSLCLIRIKMWQAFRRYFAAYDWKKGVVGARCLIYEGKRKCTVLPSWQTDRPCLVPRPHYYARPMLFWSEKNFWGLDKLGEVRHFVSLGAELLEAGELSITFPHWWKMSSSHGEYRG